MRSLNTGFSEMGSVVCDFDFDVFGVTETWLQPSTPSVNYSLPGYQMLRCDRNSNASDADGEEGGGGVAIYIKDGIQFEQHSFVNQLDPGIEAICVVLKLRGERLGLCVAYRPPNVRHTCLASLFHSLFVDLAVEVRSVICLGDMNVDLMSKTSNVSRYYSRLLKESNTTQIVNEPTRVTATSATLLDHIVVDRSVEVKRNGVVDVSSIKDHRGISITDHKLTYCIIGVTKNKIEEKMIRYRDFSSFDPEQVISEIAACDWDDILNVQDVDVVETLITTNIRRVYDKNAPVVCKKVTKRKAQWRNDDIRKMTKEKNKLRNRYWKYRCADDWERYKEIRNRLNNMIRMEKYPRRSRPAYSANFILFLIS
jgi:hypothetical protein